MKKVIERLKPSRIVVPENYLVWFEGAELEVGDEFRFDDLSYADALFFTGKEVVERWLNG
jgi:hypothetical protein